jgi:branched-chain amino acid transport system permease protein
MNLSAYGPLLESMILGIGLAYSQSVVLNAGMFVLSTAGFALLGGYAGAIAVMKWGWNPLPAMIFATLFAGAAGLALSLPLSRLRGAFQAIATLAFVQIMVSLALYAEGLTGGALGMNGIPRSVGIAWLLVFFVVLTIFMSTVSRTGVGRAFAAIRQDETVAVSLGIPVARYHTLALTLSAMIAGLTGCLMGFSTYTLSPEEFGFAMLVGALSSVVLGGRLTVGGAIVGTAVLSALPEVLRPLAEQRLLLEGALLVVVMIFMPEGIVDTLLARIPRNEAISNSAQGPSS